LKYYTAFHDVPNCWQRGLPSLEALVPHVQSWAVLENGKVAGYALGWANERSVRLVDFATAPTNDRNAVAQALLAHLHLHNPDAHGSGYNIAENDPVWPAYEALDYTITLRQIEMQFTD
jgi:hypothetical protein